jgi:hypothetical protein
MWTDFEAGTYAKNAIAFRAKREVGWQGVRHVAIDILPREPLTFRTVCNLDVAEDEQTFGEPTECERCRRLDVGKTTPTSD